MKEIKYTSDNGYTGVIYGRSSLVIYNPDGKVSLHTASRAIDTYDELVELVDRHPEVMKRMREIESKGYT